MWSVLIPESSFTRSNSDKSQSSDGSLPLCFPTKVRIRVSYVSNIHKNYST